LFGACVARALDRCWGEMGEPDPFVVMEAGAGNGRLARDVLRAQPACLGALHYVLVECSAVLREEQRERLDIEPADEALGPFSKMSSEDSPVAVAGSGPVFVSLDELPALELNGVVFANELLDNLPFGVAESRDGAWLEVRIALGPTGEFTEVLVPAEAGDAAALAAITAGIDVPAGSRLPIPRGINSWLEACGRVLRHGTLVAIDYVDDTRGVLERQPVPGSASWLRTYQAHQRGWSPLDSPGAHDITADVVLEQLQHAALAAGFTYAGDQSQAEWLGGLGVQDLVEAGRRAWEERAHVGDLQALAGRSVVSEASALTDPAGLGAHRVVTFSR
jgi:NADH dehydrogenase [ubiquinone] 1 alpha subcomplex assembly factor 7